MAIDAPMCTLCEHRHWSSEPHVLSDGKKTARKKRAGKVAATEEESGGGMTAASEKDWIVRIDGCQCARCGHAWVPVSERKPKRCPGCMSRVWLTL